MSSWLGAGIGGLGALRGHLESLAQEVLSPEGPAQPEPQPHQPDLTLLCAQQQQQIDQLKDQNEKLLKELESKHEDAAWDWDTTNDVSKQEHSSKQPPTLNTNNDAKLSDEIAALRSENDALNTSLETLDAQNQAAMEKLIELKKELQKNYELLQQEHDRLKKENESLHFRIDQKELERDEINAKLMSELESVHHKYDNLEKVYRLLTENAEKFQEENQELNEENFKLQEECTKLQHDLEELQNRNSHRDIKPESSKDHVSNEKYKELEEKFLKLEQKFSSTSDFKNESQHLDLTGKAQDVIEKLKLEIVDLQNKLNTNEEIKRLNLEIDHLKKSLDSKHENYITLEELDVLLGKNIISQATAHSKEAMLKLMENVLSEAFENKQEINALQTKLNERNVNMKESKSKIDELKAEIDILSGDVSHYEYEYLEMKKNNDFLLSEITALKNASKLETITEQCEVNVEKLETELADCSNLNKNFEIELEQLKLELNQIKAERDQAKEELNKTKSKLDDQSKINVEMDENEIINLKQKLLNIQDEYEKSRNQILSLTTEFEKYKIDHNISENENILLQREISELKAEIYAKSIIENYTKQLETEKMCLVNANEELSQQILDYNNIKSDSERLQIELSKEKSKNLELEDLNNDLRSKINELIATIKSTSQKYDDSENTNIELKEQLTRVKSNLDDTISRNDENKNEIVRLKGLLDAKCDEISITVEDRNLLQHKLDQTSEELSKLKTELESVTNDTSTSQLKEELDQYIEKVKSLEDEISTLTTETALLKEKNESLAKCNVENLNTNDNLIDLENNFKSVVNENTELKDKCSQLEKEKLSIKESLSQIEKIKEDLNNEVSSLNDEKNNLIALVTQKHQESVTYHSEIQRLNQGIQFVNEKYNELQKKHEEHTQSTMNSIDNDKYDELQNLLKEKQDVCSKLEEKLLLIEQSGVTPEALEKLDEKNNFLIEKCDILGKNLIIEQSQNKLLLQEKNQALEKEQALCKELERLREHLMNVEDSHAQEIIVMEQRCEEMQNKLTSIEEKAKQTSTMYTSNSIRANQEVETLRTQIRLVEKQRDDIQVKLGESEDKNNKNEAALTNLMCVLEQFQMDKDRDADMVAGKIKKELTESKKEILILHERISHLESKLEDSNNGLRAAARLSDQLETKTAQLIEAKQQVADLEQNIKDWQKKFKDSTSNQQDKVDKSLVKNLLMGYIQAINSNRNSNDKVQVLKLLSTVLDMDKSECDRVGLGPTKSSHSSESLAQEFIKFLEKESVPKSNVAAPKLNINQIVSPLGSQRKKSIKDVPDVNNLEGIRPTSSPKLTASPIGAVANPVPIIPISLNNNPLLANVSPVTIVSNETPALGLFTPISGPDLGVSHNRNNEGAILKNILKESS